MTRQRDVKLVDDVVHSESSSMASSQNVETDHAETTENVSFPSLSRLFSLLNTR